MPITGASNCLRNRQGRCFAAATRPWHTEATEAAVCEHTSGALPREAKAEVAASCAPREVPRSAVFSSAVFFLPLLPCPLGRRGTVIK